MIYLASPYSHDDPLVRKTRYLLAMECVAHLMRVGKFVWSPIVHCHELSVQHDLPGDAEFWKGYDHDFIRRADAVFVLTIPGWQESKGVKMEVAFAEMIGIPVVYINVEGDRVQ